MRLIIMILVLVQQGFSEKLICSKDDRKIEYKVNDFDIVECNCNCTMQNNKFFIKDNNIIYELSEVSKILPVNKIKKSMSATTEYFLKNKKYCDNKINVKQYKLSFFTLVPHNDTSCYEFSAFMTNKGITILKEYVTIVTHATIEVKKALLYDYPEGRNKGFLVKGNDIKILKKKSDWIYISYEGKKQVNAWIRKKDIKKGNLKKHNLLTLEKTLKAKKTLKTYNKAFFEKLLPEQSIEKTNLTTYNNIAYYLQKAGSNKEAVYLLEKILKKYPKRMVAYYNLGDAYWALGDKKKAKEAYTTYIEQMCDAGKQKRIPKIVKQRVESK